MTARALLLVMLSVGWWRIPAACANGRSSGGQLQSTMRRAALMTVGLVAILALCSGPLLETLEVDTETFRIATGLAVAGLGLARVLGWGLTPEEPNELANGWLWPVAYPVLIGPELVLVAVSVGSDHGILATTLSATFAVSLAFLAARVVRAESDWFKLPGVVGVRGAGVGLVVLAVALVFDGLRDI